MSEESNVDDHIQQTLNELGIPEVDWKRHVSAADILYLLDQCPFLQLTDTGLQSSEVTPLQIIPAKSGWKIHHYGNALSSSPGELLFGGGARKDDDGEGDSGFVPGAGTLVNQAVNTAFQMVDLAIQAGWSGIQLVDGHPLMAWAAWMQALDAGIELQGFEPTAKDLSKRRRIKQSAEQVLARRPSLS